MAASRGNAPELMSIPNQGAIFSVHCRSSEERVAQNLATGAVITIW
jgi:hypothetical protein